MLVDDQERVTLGDLIDYLRKPGAGDALGALLERAGYEHPADIAARTMVHLDEWEVGEIVELVKNASDGIRGAVGDDETVQEWCADLDLAIGMLTDREE